MYKGRRRAGEEATRKRTMKPKGGNMGRQLTLYKGMIGPYGVEWRTKLDPKSEQDERREFSMLRISKEKELKE